MENDRIIRVSSDIWRKWCKNLKLAPILRLDDNIKLKGDRILVEKSDTIIQVDEISQLLERDGFVFNQTLLKDCLQALTQNLMDIEVSQILDASRYERNTTRRAYRNGYRSTVWSTSIGNIELRVPKLRRGTYYPDQLLNESWISESLIQLITVCLLQSVDEDYVAETLSELNLMTLSPYNIHQLCDVIRLYSEQIDAKSIDDENVVVERLPATYYRHRLMMINQNVDEHSDMMSIDDRLQLDREFWQDFVRRMVQAGVLVENHQSILSSVNPYAVIQLEEYDSALHLNFADTIYPLYKEDYLRIA
jgi:hypothetical protein